MAVPPKIVPPEILAEARRLYEHTRVPVDDIAALVGISTRTLYSRIRKWKWRRRIERVPLHNPPADDRPPPQPAEAAAVAGLALARRRELEPFGDSTASVEERVMRAIERQIHAVEQIVVKLNPTPEHADEAERAARSLASLSRTLMELQALSTTKSKDADGFPENLDDLRQELAARIERLAAGAPGVVLRQPGEPE